MAKHKHYRGSKLWAVFVIIMGGYFLAEQYGIWPEEIGFPWAIFMIVIGIYWLIDERCCSGCDTHDK